MVSLSVFRFHIGLLLFLCSAFLTVLSPQLCGAKPVRVDDSAIGQQLRLPVYQWRDNERRPRGVIMAVHGLTFYAKSFDNFARYLTSKGYIVYAPDLRGFGRWRHEYYKFGGDDKFHFGRNEEDLTRVLTAIRKQHPNLPVIGLGESLGASYVVSMLAEGQAMDGAILAAPSIAVRKKPRLRWLPDLARSVVLPTQPLDVSPYMADTVSNDPKVVRSILSDRNMKHELSPINLIKASLQNMKTRKHLGKVPDDVPILIMAGENDRMFNAEKIRKHAIEKGSGDLTYVAVPGTGHLLMEHQPLNPKVTAATTHWLDRNHARITARHRGNLM